MVRFFKTDTFAERGEPISAKYWITFAGIICILLVYDLYNGYTKFDVFKAKEMEHINKVQTRRIVKILKKDQSQSNSK